MKHNLFEYARRVFTGMRWISLCALVYVSVYEPPRAVSTALLCVCVAISLVSIVLDAIAARRQRAARKKRDLQNF